MGLYIEALDTNRREKEGQSGSPSVKFKISYRGEAPGDGDITVEIMLKSLMASADGLAIRSIASKENGALSANGFGKMGAVTTMSASDEITVTVSWAGEASQVELDELFGVQISGYKMIRNMDPESPFYGASDGVEPIFVDRNFDYGVIENDDKGRGKVNVKDIVETAKFLDTVTFHKGDPQRDKAERDALKDFLKGEFGKIKNFALDDFSAPDVDELFNQLGAEAHAPVDPPEAPPADPEAPPEDDSWDAEQDWAGMEWDGGDWADHDAADDHRQDPVEEAVDDAFVLPDAVAVAFDDPFETPAAIGWLNVAAPDYGEVAAALDRAADPTGENDDAEGWWLSEIMADWLGL